MSVLKRYILPFWAFLTAFGLLASGLNSTYAAPNALLAKILAANAPQKERNEQSGPKHHEESLEVYTVHFQNFKLQSKQLFEQPIIWHFRSQFLFSKYVLIPRNALFNVEQQVDLCALPIFYVLFRHIISINAP